MKTTIVCNSQLLGSWSEKRILLYLFCIRIRRRRGPRWQSCLFLRTTLQTMSTLLSFLGEYSSSQRIELDCQHTATMGGFFCQDVTKKLSAEDSACQELRSSGLPEAGLVTASERAQLLRGDVCPSPLIWGKGDMPTLLLVQMTG